MLIKQSNDTSERKGFYSPPDAIPYNTFQQQRPIQLETISKTRRVVPKAQGHEEKSPSLLPLPENFEKGCYHRVSHYSICYQSNMTFGIFIPSSYANDPNQSNPVLLFLGGLLTCDDTNFLESESGQCCAFEAAERQVSHHVLLQYPNLPKSYAPFSDLYRFSFHLLWPSSSVGHCNRNSSRFISKRTCRTTPLLHWWRSIRPCLNRRWRQLRYQ